MAWWRVLACLTGALVLAMATSGVTAAQEVNPCDGPAGDHNPNCVDGEFTPGAPSQPLPPEGLPNLVTIDPLSSGVGTYLASGAAFGPTPTVEGITGEVVLVNDGSSAPTLGCGSLVGFPEGAIALVDRGTCTFVDKAISAQRAGAVAVIVVNSLAGDAIPMAGTAPQIRIPAVMVSLADGTTIKAGLPATGRVRSSS